MASNTDEGSSDSGSGDNNIQVFIRIRPPSEEDNIYSNVVETDETSKKIILKQDPNPDDTSQRTFAFDYVFDINMGQEEIFNRLGKKVIENAIAGYNGTIFAYGQTGSGKTFTMLGPSEDSDNFKKDYRGVIPRSFEYLYQLISREKELHGDNKQFLCKCSFLEIYNEQIFDLLEPSNNILHLRDSFKTGVYVSGLSEQVVQDASEAYEVLNSSWMNRTVASTSMNRESSRSHAVFTLQIESKERKGSVEHIKTSQLHLVDLAGSERQKDTKSTGKQLREAGSINKSLSNLGNVIMALVSVARDGKNRFVPYRDSKLTFLLRDSLGGNSKTSLIACVHSGHKCFGETLSTLLFAKRAKMIKTQAVKNENSLGNVRQLQAEIKKLKEELSALKSGAIVRQPSISEQPMVNMPVLKEMFLQAMCLRQKSEMEKLELHKAIEDLKVIIGKKDKAMQTKMMVIKFREESIKRLEGKMKNPSEEDSQLNGLKKELEAMKSLVDHHPAVSESLAEIRKLKSVIKSLKEDNGILGKIQSDTEKAKQLEEEYKKLVSEEKDPTGVHSTPQRADTVSTSTVNTLRSQITDLESKNEQLNQELSDQKKEMEKKEKYLQGEIDSYKKTVEELELVISANNMKTKLEKDALNEMHIQTVLTITTPKKEAYKLRSRTVVTKSNTPDLDTSIPFESAVEDEGIMGECVPQEMATQQQDALCDEIKMLQDLNNKLETRISEYETDRVKQAHEQSVLMSKLKSLEELYEQEKSQFTKQKEEFGKILEEKKMAVEEVIDLKAMLAQSDRTLLDIKNKEKTTESDTDALQTKLSALDVMLKQVEKDNYKLNEEYEQLAMVLEVEAQENSYHRKFIDQLENRIKENDNTIKELQQNLMGAEKAILDEKETLVEQLNCVGAEKTQITLRQIEERNNLMKEIDTLKNMLEDNDHSASRLRKTIDEKNFKINHLEKAMKTLEEKLYNNYQRLQESDNTVAELKQTLESRDEQIGMYSSKEESLNSRIEELQNLIEEKELAFTTKCSGLEMEVCVLKDELSFYERSIEDQKEAYEATQESLHKAEIEKQNALRVIEQLKEKLKTENTPDTAELAELTTKLESLAALRQEQTQENLQLKTSNSELQKKYDDLKANNDCMKSQYMAVYEELKEKTSELVSLSADSSCNRELLKATEAEKETLNERISVLEIGLSDKEQENKELESTVERLHGVAKHDNEENEKLRHQISSVETKLSELCELYEISKEEESVDTLLKMAKATKEEYDKLLVENCNLGGHSNTKQKIKYHAAVKTENAQLKKDILSIEEKNRHVLEENRELKRQLKDVKNKHLTRAKENDPPPAHKTFLSGSYTLKSPNIGNNS